MEKQIFSSISIDELKTVITENVIDEVKKLLLPQNTESESSELITRKQTAQILGISLVTLAHWQREGLIPAYRINTRVRFKRAEVISCLSAIQTKSFKSVA